MGRYFTIIHLVLIAVIAYLGVFIFYRIITQHLETVPIGQAPVSEQTHPQPPPKAIAPTSFEKYQAAIDRNLFNTATADTEPEDEKVDVKALKQTQLGLKLWGTVYGITGKAFAVIEETATRKQRLFSIGDEVESAIVEMILREKVILGVNGKKEVLTMEKPARAGRAAPTRGVSRQPQPSPQPSPVPSAPPDENGKEMVIQRSRIEDAIQNVNQLMQYVRIRPHFTNGEPDGLRLTGVRPGTIFTEIGFRNGDIITGVNGKRIESVDDALQFYTSLKNATNVDLQLRRRGEDKSIRYRVED